MTGIRIVLTALHFFGAAAGASAQQGPRADKKIDALVADIGKAVKLVALDVKVCGEDFTLQVPHGTIVDYYGGGGGGLRRRNIAFDLSIFPGKSDLFRVVELWKKNR